MLRLYSLPFCFAVFATLAQSQSSNGDLRVAAVWMDQYPILNVAVECVPKSLQATCEVPKDLLLVEEGGSQDQPAEVKALSDTKIGTALVLALDASGSMRGWPIAAIRKALAGYTGKSRPEDQLALLSFADDVRTNSPFRGDRSQWPTLLSSLQTRCCHTHLYDAISQSSGLLQDTSLPPIRRVLVISDGKDEGSTISIDDAIKQANSERTVVDAIGISGIQPVFLQSLERIATETGGIFRRANSDKELEGFIGLGINQMLAGQVASFRILRAAADGVKHTFTITRPGSDWKAERTLELPLQKIPALPPSATPPSSAVTMSIVISGGVLLLLLLFRLVFWRRRNLAKESEQTMHEPVFESPARNLAFTGLTDLPVSSSPTMGESRKQHEAAVTRPNELLRKRNRKTVMLHRFQEPRSDSPSAWLTQIAGQDDDEHLVYALIKTKTWFGASPAATIQLPATDGILPLHACLEFEDGSFYLSSESPSALVSLNDQAFSSSRRLVMPGDQITTGKAVFRLELTRPSTV